MNTTRIIAVSLVAACAAIAPTTALARHGADDDPAVADDRGGQQAQSPSSDDGARTDDTSGRRGGKRAKQLVRVTGECSATSRAKLKVKRDRGRLKAEFEVDQNVNGVTWDVTISRNGDVAVDTTATTRAPSGSFEVERRLRNGAGPDDVSARAESPTGEVCTAQLTI